MIFRSRWRAMLWSLGMLWFAVGVAGFSHHEASATKAKPVELQDATGAPVTAEDLAVLKHLIE